MVQVIVVEPFAQGWAVRQPSVDNSQIFNSGAKAEDAARMLGTRLAESGTPAEIQVYLRNGALAGRFLMPAVA